MRNRQEILATIEAMPEEAFGYVLLAMVSVVRQYEGNHGFMPASTRSFVLLALALNAYGGGELVDIATVREHNPTLFDADGRVSR